MRSKQELEEKVQYTKNIIDKLRRTGLLDQIGEICFRRDLTMLYWFLGFSIQEANKKSLDILPL